MKSTFLKDLLVAAGLAILLCGFVATPAAAQGGGKVQMQDIHFFTAAFGGADGSVVATDGDGLTRVLAVGTRNRVKVIDGTKMPRLVTASWCRETTNGFLFACRAPDYPIASPTGAPTEFDCGVDVVTGDTFCGCAGAFDCLEMLAAGVCEEGTLECDDDGCTCDF